MIRAMQLGTVSPGQLVMVQPGQLTTAPGVVGTQISDLLTSIMPLMMMMMVMMSIGTHQALQAPTKEPASGNETP